MIKISGGNNEVAREKLMPDLDRIRMLMIENSVVIDANIRKKSGLLYYLAKVILYCAVTVALNRRGVFLLTLPRNTYV